MTEAGAKVSRGAISNWERGTNGIVSSKLPTLARILGCSEGYLLRGELQAETNRSKESQQDTKAVGANKEQADAPSAAISSNQKTISPTPDTNSQNNAMRGHSMNPIKKSNKLQNVCYDIRGPSCKPQIKWKQKANVY